MWPQDYEIAITEPELFKNGNDLFGRDVQLPVKTGISVSLPGAKDFQSAVRLNADFRQATGRWVSTQTIRNRFHASNSRACRPTVRPILTRQHSIARQHWAMDQANWQLCHWTPVLFTDESRFHVDFHDDRIRV